MNIMTSVFPLESQLKLASAVAVLVWAVALGATAADEGVVAEAGQKVAQPLAGADDAPPRPKRQESQRVPVQVPAEVPVQVPAEEARHDEANSVSSDGITKVETKDETIAHARALSRAFRDSAQIALPSAVTVFSLSKSSHAANNPILNMIGGRNEQRFDNVGSGVIIQSDGLILTNHHVVADAAQIEVRLQDGRQFEAEALKSDRQSDVAILKINVNEELPAAKIGRSKDLFVGDWVLAIGSPFMIEASVSAGIISGTGRYQTLSREVKGQFLQTDAAINPGNSGGPLLNLDGEVIGINTAISSRTGGFEGIGFAIPIDRAMWIKQELQNYDHVRRGHAGISLDNVPIEMARELNLPAGTGALVISLIAERPAAKAGVKRGDVIIDFAGGRVQSNSGFRELVQQSPIGEPLALTVLRDGKRIELTMELIESPTEQ